MDWSIKEDEFATRYRRERLQEEKLKDLNRHQTYVIIMAMFFAMSIGFEARIVFAPQMDNHPVAVHKKYDGLERLTTTGEDDEEA